MLGRLIFSPAPNRGFILCNLIQSNNSTRRGFSDNRKFNERNSEASSNVGFQRRVRSNIPSYLSASVEEGDIYSPNDLLFETVKAKNQAKFYEPVREDCFKTVNENPMNYWKNPVILSRFVTELGRIKPRGDTGLTAKNQRLLSRAIRRARAAGIMPTKYKSVYSEN